MGFFVKTQTDKTGNLKITSLREY